MSGLAIFIGFCVLWIVLIIFGMYRVAVTHGKGKHVGTNGGGRGKHSSGSHSGSHSKFVHGVTTPSQMSLTDHPMLH